MKRHWLNPIIEGKRKTHEDVEWRFQIVETRGAVHVRDAQRYENGGWMAERFRSVDDAKQYCEAIE